MLAKLVRAVKNPSIISTYLRWQFNIGRIGVHNVLISREKTTPVNDHDLQELREIYARMKLDTDISDHLLTLFVETLSARPQLIVELGVRGGDSTFVLERAARLSHAQLISVDIDDCSDISTWNEWLFHQGDDIAFAGQFSAYCIERHINPVINVLFIDTSHLYEHTVDELRSWFPLLSPHAKVLFHDTNQRRRGRRRDGRLMAGIDNLGVMKALEAYFHRSFDANQDFVTVCDGWTIRHSAVSNGFTILERIPEIAGTNR